MIALILNKENKNYVYSLLENVEFPEQFGFNDDTDELDCNEDILAVVNDVDVAVKSCYGASKYVLMNDSLSYVIKIPFNGFWTETYTDDEVDSEEIEYEFSYFNGACRDSYATDMIYSDNYCKTEMRLFQVMEEQGLDMFFARIEYAGTINGKEVYVQEKVIPYKRSKKTGVSSPLAEKLSSTPRIYLESDWIEAAIQFYGEVLTKQFINFLSTDEDGEIIGGDLHTDNYGYREDGSPCLLDYSGYNV